MPTRQSAMSVLPPYAAREIGGRLEFGYTAVDRLKIRIEGRPEIFIRSLTELRNLLLEAGANAFLLHDPETGEGLVVVDDAEKLMGLLETPFLKTARRLHLNDGRWILSERYRITHTAYSILMSFLGKRFVGVWKAEEDHPEKRTAVIWAE